MGKLALVLPRAGIEAMTELPKRRTAVIEWDDNIFYLHALLADRDECETDRNYLQLIPYIALVRDGKMYCYSRGGKTDEERLRAKLSVGLGGHIDRLPAEHESLYILAMNEACRELQEEVQLEADFQDLDDLGFVYDPAKGVGEVHLGLVLMYEVPADVVLGSEEGHVEKGQWLTIEELKAEVIYARLENWSRAVVDYMEVNQLVNIV